MRAALEDVNDRIERACARAGRKRSSVALLPVTKTVPPQRLADAVELGLTVFGENRVQEAESKVPALPNVRWQLIGHLQSNKAARAVAMFECVHSVDSVGLAQRLDQLAASAGSRLPVYLQVNVDDDPHKAGFAPAQLTASLAELVLLRHLELGGLMTVGRLVDTAEDARPTFAALRRLSDELRTIEPELEAGLSMGMSTDFEVAIEEGATVVRVGSAIFGPRRR